MQVYASTSVENPREKAGSNVRLFFFLSYWKFQNLDAKDSTILKAHVSDRLSVVQRTVLYNNCAVSTVVRLQFVRLHVYGLQHTFVFHYVRCDSLKIKSEQNFTEHFHKVFIRKTCKITRMSAIVYQLLFNTANSNLITSFKNINLYLVTPQIT